MDPEERQQFAKKIMTPLESIAKHLTDHSKIEESKFDENENSEAINLPLTRYQEISLDDKNEKQEKVDSLELDKDSEAYLDPNNEDDRAEENVTVPSNHRISVDEDYANTEKYEIDLQRTTESVKTDCAYCDDATTIEGPESNARKTADLAKDFDTVEGFHFSDGPSRSD